MNNNHKRTVLFVCTGNYYRSRYAEHDFNARVPPELGWRADSRGFEPSPLNPGPINADVAELLRARGAAPQEFRAPQRLSEADLAQADLVVILDEDEHRPYMRAGFPAWSDRVRYWRVADLHGLTVPEALALIGQEVGRLIEQLAAEDARPR
jgi:protein-tyrosine phosphatase